ncbi:MAG: response regulator [Candidatus Riflebacteria bacterium]|nr:response regulator [Candidatus Riflebacteria bacterium]
MTHKQRILIVDDEETILDLLSEALFADGYEVMTASNGACALDRMRETPPDLVLLDLYMPVMDGYEVLEKIRAEPAFKAIPTSTCPNRCSSGSSGRG